MAVAGVERCTTVPPNLSKQSKFIEFGAGGGTPVILSIVIVVATDAIVGDDGLGVEGANAAKFTPYFFLSKQWSKFLTVNNNNNNNNKPIS